MPKTAIDERETFKEIVLSTAKAYHYMQRTVGPVALPDGTITSEMLDAHVEQWLNSGYTLMSVHFLGVAKDPGGAETGSRFGYHFVSQ